MTKRECNKAVLFLTWEGVIENRTQFPDLFEHLTEVTKIIDLNNEEGLEQYDVDLENYVTVRRPQTNEPRRHLIEHTFEIAEETLGNGILERNFAPKIVLTDVELRWAQREATGIAGDKPLVWLQTRSRMKEKDIPESIWQELISNGSKRYAFVDLSQLAYARREAIALTAVADAGITLDSFLLHGSKAVQARNVLVVLVSTHPEVVCYPDQTIINIRVHTKSVSAQVVLNALETMLRVTRSSTG